MNIKEIKSEEFNEFAKNHALKNFYQTKEYGELMSHSDFQVMYVGGYINKVLVAASLIQYKSIGINMKYGYAPRGFLVDYYNSEVLISFTKKIKDFFFLKGFAFIKINPEITYSVIDYENKSKTINSRNKQLIHTLKELGYDKLKDNLYFESLLPKYTPVIYLPNYDFNKLDNSILETIKNNDLCGIKLINGTVDNIDKFYSFVDKKNNKTAMYYKYFFEIFNKSDMADLLLCELDYSIYVKYLQKQYVIEQEKNEKINVEFNNSPNNTSLYEQKTKSDQTLAKISSEIALSNTRMEENSMKEIIGGAFIVKHQGRVTIVISGNSKSFASIDVKTYMFYKIIEVYKKAGYSYLDLYGITADFSDSNPYKDLNNFKLKFKPTVFEYIGELDLIVNKPFHQILWSTNQIQKEFYKPPIKNS